MPVSYKNSKSAWGLEGFYEGQRLLFSGGFDKAQKSSAKTIKNPGSIISNVDVYELFSPNAKRAWQEAGRLAKKHGGWVGVEDIFLALLKSPSVQKLFKRFKVQTESAKTLLENYLKLKPGASTMAVKQLPFEAFNLSLELHNHKIGGLMLLGALLKTTPEDNILQAIFANMGLTLEKLKILATWMFSLNYQPAETSNEGKTLFCCRQVENLERHFGYFYEFSAIETAIALANGQTFKDLEHLKALQLLVKAGLLSKNKNEKNISQKLVSQAAGA